MVNMTLAIPDKLHSVMKKHSDVKWTEVARQAIVKKAALLESGKDPLRAYALRRWADEGDDAEKLFEF